MRVMAVKKKSYKMKMKMKMKMVYNRQVYITIRDVFFCFKILRKKIRDNIFHNQTQQLV
jgi:hypothetical protein